MRDTDGVEVWPSVSSWMRNETRSKVTKGDLCKKYYFLNYNET